MEEYIKAAKVGSEVFPWSLKDISVLAPVLTSKSRVVRKMKRKLFRGYHTDTDTLLSLLRTSLIRRAKLPVLDGLYGGAACFRTTDNSKLGPGGGTLHCYYYSRATHCEEGRGSQV